jgi:hypothetical protein
LDGIGHVGEADLGGDVLGPPPDLAGIDLYAGPAGAAGEMVVRRPDPALAVERLAVGAADGVHCALPGQDVQLPVRGGEADPLAGAACQQRVQRFRAGAAGPPPRPLCG